MAHGEFVHIEHQSNKNEVRNVTIILTVLTLIELGLGFLMMKMADGSSLKLATKITIIVLMLLKAYYIVGYFMHLKHEIRNFIMTIMVPLTLFVWFIIAFLKEGDSYLDLKNRFDPSYKERRKEPAKPHEGHGAETHEMKAEEGAAHH